MERNRRRSRPGFGSSLSALIIAIISSASLIADTAVLQCTADGYSSGTEFVTRGRELRLPGLIIAAFRSWNVTGWRVASGTLFLHVQSGTAPDSLEWAAIREPWGEIQAPRMDPSKLTFVSTKVEIEPEGWISASIPGPLVEELAINKAHGIVIRIKAAKELVLHAREAGSFSPYLIVTGTPR